MTTAVTEQDQVVDLDALNTDATTRLGELREQRGRLALDALVDSDIARELEAVEREIAETQQALERVSLARTEHGRREAAARAAAEAAARDAALERARKLASVRTAAAKAVDDAAAALAAAVTWWVDTADEQDVALTEAGRRPSSNAAQARVFALEGAFKLATRELPRGLLALEAVVSPPHVKRLVEADLRPVEPMDDKPTKGTER